MKSPLIVPEAIEDLHLPDCGGLANMPDEWKQKLAQAGSEAKKSWPENQSSPWIRGSAARR